MNIVIPFDGRVRTIIRSSFVAAKRLTENQYTLTDDTFQMRDVTAEQVLEVLPESWTSCIVHRTPPTFCAIM